MSPVTPIRPCVVCGVLHPRRQTGELGEGLVDQRHRGHGGGEDHTPSPRPRTPAQPTRAPASPQMRYSGADSAISARIPEYFGDPVTPVGSARVKVPRGEPKGPFPPGPKGFGTTTETGAVPVVGGACAGGPDGGSWTSVELTASQGGLYAHQGLDSTLLTPTAAV